MSRSHTEFVPFSADQALRWTQGTLLRGDRETLFSGVSIDTRTVAPGMLFVAIVGEVHDAHTFLDTALSNGASGLMVEPGRDLTTPSTALGHVTIEVSNTTAALGALGAGHRSGFDAPVVAITGSNGKTTTKEMCASILSRRAPCLRNEGNLNNHFGLPLTLLRRRPSDHFAVVELGMNHRGEIAELAEIARPDVGVITNIGTAHLENLGSREEIAREKGDLVAALPAHGTAVVNADDPRMEDQAKRTAARILRFGHSAAAEVRAEGVAAAPGGRIQFGLIAPTGECDISVAGMGEATVINALAAGAAALAAGATLEEVKEGLAAYQPVPGRLVRIDLPGDVIVIDDTYNANPQSVDNALRALVELPDQTQRIAVLGEMGELGDLADSAHYDIGNHAADLGINYVVAVGSRSHHVVRGAVDGGLPVARALEFSTCEQASEHVKELLIGGTAVLVKGSRSARMERVVHNLVDGKAD
ncbi:UDP-N-acetylmuramoyl-tripeptide--D-alanyl-D-alanine ligase [Myxococcota bacterium]|nr:UDP-N-acetylmuramoyl-tripeptide--D-alanyl-D-alanine ligase [Myxococcota bacterium]